MPGEFTCPKCNEQVVKKGHTEYCPGNLLIQWEDESNEGTEQSSVWLALIRHPTNAADPAPYFQCFGEEGGHPCKKRFNKIQRLRQHVKTCNYQGRRNWSLKGYYGNYEDFKAGIDLEARTANDSDEDIASPQTTPSKKQRRKERRKARTSDVSMRSVRDDDPHTNSDKSMEVDSPPPRQRRKRRSSIRHQPSPQASDHEEETHVTPPPSPPLPPPPPPQSKKKNTRRASGQVPREPPIPERSAPPPVDNQQGEDDAAQVPPDAAGKSVPQTFEEMVNSQCTIRGEFMFHPILERYGIAKQVRLDRLICLKDQRIVPPTMLHSHIKSHKSHKHYASEKLLKAICAKLEINEDPPIPPSPVDVPKEFAGFETCEWGCVCPEENCGQGAVNEGAMKTHYNQYHKNKRFNKKKLTHSALQRFIRTGPGHTPWFAVHRRTRIPSDVNLVRLMKDAANSRKRKVTLPAKDLDLRLIEPWLLFTKWHLLFDGYDSLEVMQTIALPDESSKRAKEDWENYSQLKEHVLQLLTKATKKIQGTHEKALCCLNTAEAASAPNHMPLSPFQNNETLASYSLVVYRLILFLLRLLENTNLPADKTPNKEKYDGFTLQLPEHIHTLVQQLETLYRQTKDHKAADYGTLIHKIVVALWTHEWYPTEDNIEPDPTMQVAALLSLSSTGSFADGAHTTGTYARFQSCMRLIFLLEAHNRADAVEFAERMSNTARGQPDAPLTRNRHQALLEQVYALQRWFTEDEVCSFRSVRRLMHYASSLAASTAPMSRLFWNSIGERMTYDGTPVTFEQFRLLVRLNQEKLMELWAELTRNTGVYFRYTGQLFDDARNKDPGFNWTQDARNRKHFRDPDLFISYFAEYPELRKFFVENLPGTDDPWWKMDNIAKWLRTYAEFHEQLMIAVELNTAGPARGTEITAMALNNLETTQRNVYFLDDQFVLRRRYNKMQNRTGKDFTIPEALDAFTSECFIQDQGMLREFAVYLADLYFPQDVAAQNVYRTSLFVNLGKRFTTDNLSHAMGNLTERVFGERWGVNDMRHIIIAFKRKRNPSLFAIHSTGQTLESAMSGHSRTADLIYATSMDIWEGAEEDITPLYIAKTYDWQLDLRLVPGNRRGSLEQSRYINFDMSWLPPENNPEGLSDAAISAIADKLFARFDFDIKRLVKAAVTEAVEETLASSMRKMEEKTQELMDKARVETVSAVEHLLRQYFAGGPVTSAAPLQAAQVHTPPPAASTPIIQSPVPPPRSHVPLSTPATEHTSPGRTSSPPVDDMEDLYAPNPFIGGEAYPTSPAPPPSSSAPETHTTSPDPEENENEEEHTWVLHPDDALDGEVSTTQLKELALAQLRQFLSKGSALLQDIVWRSLGQEGAVINCLEYKTDGLYILATGSGKTLIPAIAAYVERDSLTVVAVPLNAIYISTQAAFDDAGVEYALWSPGLQLQRQDRLLLTTYNRAAMSSFMATLSHGYHQYHYARIRIALDEGHLAASEMYRGDVMKVIGELRRVAPNVQVVSYTGTVPPEAEPSVRQALLLRPGAGTTVIRTPTNRPELSLMLLPQKSNMTDCAALIKTWWRFVTEEDVFDANADRALIFVQTGDAGIELVDIFAKRYRQTVDFYYGRKVAKKRPLNDKQRAEMLGRWERGETATPFLIATVGLAQGYHYPGIRAVFSVGLADGATQQLQECARAGRDGKTGWAFMIPFANDNHPYTGGGVDIKGKSALTSLVFVNKTACLRKGLFGYMDGGENASKCMDDPHNVLCSRCNGSCNVHSSRRLVAPANAPPARPIQTPALVGQKRSQSDAPPPLPAAHRSLHRVEGTLVTAPSAPARAARPGPSGFADMQKVATDQRIWRINNMQDSFIDLRAAWQFFRGLCPLCLIQSPNRRDCLEHSRIGLCPHVWSYGDAYRYWSAEIFKFDIPEFNEPPLHYLCWLPAVPAMPHPPLSDPKKTCKGSFTVKIVVFFAVFNTTPEFEREFRSAFTDVKPLNGWQDMEGRQARLRWIITKKETRRFINYLEVFIWMYKRVTGQL
ncbi:unnamed protein product [Peniophora sp. CBMAI 1063]|nr:unnamed protein product [Peniophora sp. CBMAI 1063]